MSQDRSRLTINKKLSGPNFYDLDDVRTPADAAEIL
jgi:hypothetical protein